jgi:hypothetical protein
MAEKASRGDARGTSCPHEQRPVRSMFPCQSFPLPTWSESPNRRSRNYTKKKAVANILQQIKTVSAPTHVLYRF